MAHLALLANPRSGAGEAERVEHELRELGAEVRRYRLDDGGRAAVENPERIVVAGGDGSIGIAAEAASRAGVPLGVVAVGTANDFARTLELPTELGPACELAARGTELRALDLARFGERPFVNVASAGLPPLAARKAHGLKRGLGPLAYVAGALRVGIGADPFDCRIECDGTEVFSGRAWQVTVAGTGAFGAGAEVEADPGDALLDLVVIEAGARLRLIARAHGLRRGRIEGQDGVRSARASEVAVRTDGATGFNVDGELVDVAEARVTLEPAAFELVVG